MSSPQIKSLITQSASKFSVPRVTTVELKKDGEARTVHSNSQTHTTKNELGAKYRAKFDEQLKECSIQFEKLKRYVAILPPSLQLGSSLPGSFGAVRKRFTLKCEEKKVNLEKLFHTLPDAHKSPIAVFFPTPRSFYETLFRPIFRSWETQYQGSPDEYILDVNNVIFREHCNSNECNRWLDKNYTWKYMQQPNCLEAIYAKLFNDPRSEKIGTYINFLMSQINEFYNSSWMYRHPILPFDKMNECCRIILCLISAFLDEGASLALTAREDYHPPFVYLLNVETLNFEDPNRPSMTYSVSPFKDILKEVISEQHLKQVAHYKGNYYTLLDWALLNEFKYKRYVLFLLYQKLLPKLTDIKEMIISLECSVHALQTTVPALYEAPGAYFHIASYNQERPAYFAHPTILVDLKKYLCILESAYETITEKKKLREECGTKNLIFSKGDNNKELEFILEYGKRRKAEGQAEAQSLKEKLAATEHENRVLRAAFEGFKQKTDTLTRLKAGDSKGAATLRL